jgi:hypothetical protein
MSLMLAQGIALGQSLSQSVGIMGAVYEQDLPCLNGFEHIRSRASVMRLPFGQLQRNRPALRIDRA